MLTTPQVCKSFNYSHKNTQCKVKILPRGQKKSQVIVGLEDLTQIEELKIVKEKAKLADQHLQIFFEYFKCQIGQFFHAIDASCSVILDDPAKQLMQAKRKTAKLFNTVQNLAAFRKQDNQDGGVYNILQFQYRQRLKTVNPNFISNFSFNSIIDEMRNMFPQLNNSMNTEQIKISNTLTTQIYMFNDLDRIKCIFITLFSQFEECLPEKTFRDIRINYDCKKEAYYESIQVNISLPAPIDWVRNQQFNLNQNNSDSNNKSTKQDACQNIKSLLNYYRQENVEIREIEIAMMRFYLSQLSPYEMQIKEDGDIDLQQTSRLSNSVLNNRDNSYSTHRIYDNFENECGLLETNTQRLNMHRKESYQQESSLTDLEPKRSIRGDSKIEQEIQNQTKKRNCEKKLSYFFKEAKNTLEQENFKSITISISFFKDLRVILQQKIQTLQTNSSFVNQNYLDNPKNNESKNFILPNITQKKESTSKHSLGNIVVPISPLKPNKIKRNDSRANSNLFQPSSPLSIASYCQSPTNQKERKESQISIPEFIYNTITKLNSLQQSIPKEQQLISNLNFENQQSPFLYQPNLDGDDPTITDLQTNLH